MRVHRRWVQHPIAAHFSAAYLPPQDQEDRMRYHSILDSPDGYRRSGSAGHTLTRALLVPSQDVCRYQARDMPRPTYDLDRKEAPAPWLKILVASLAVVATGAGIIFIQRIVMWLRP
jgi:hypothetical protein